MDPLRIDCSTNPIQATSDTSSVRQKLQLQVLKKVLEAEQEMANEALQMGSPLGQNLDLRV